MSLYNPLILVSFVNLLPARSHLLEQNLKKKCLSEKVIYYSSCIGIISQIDVIWCIYLSIASLDSESSIIVLKQPRKDFNEWKPPKWTTMFVSFAFAFLNAFMNSGLSYVMQGVLISFCTCLHTNSNVEKKHLSSERFRFMTGRKCPFLPGYKSSFVTKTF